MLLLGALSAYCSGSACLHIEQMDADVRFDSCNSPQASSALLSSALRCHISTPRHHHPPLSQHGPSSPGTPQRTLPLSSRSLLPLPPPAPSSRSLLPLPPPSLPLLLSSPHPPTLPRPPQPTPLTPLHRSSLALDETSYLHSGIAQIAFAFLSVPLPHSFSAIFLTPFLYDAKPVDAQKPRNRKAEKSKPRSREAGKPESQEVVPRHALRNERDGLFPVFVTATAYPSSPHSRS